MDEPPFDIILVEPKESLNVGAVARAMSNFGFARLVLVSPVHYSPETAKRTGRHAEEILDAVEIVDSLSAACADSQVVVGFTARNSKNRLSRTLLPNWIDELSQSSSRKVSLVFGPEATGLRQEHLEFCNQLVAIPTAEENSSLNLAQAVVLVLYELFASSSSKSAVDEEDSELVAAEKYAHLERLVLESADRSGFIGTASPDAMPGVLKSLFRKTLYTEREMQILMGLFDRISKSLP